MRLFTNRIDLRSQLVISGWLFGAVAVWFYNPSIEWHPESLDALALLAALATWRLGPVKGLCVAMNVLAVHEAEWWWFFLLKYPVFVSLIAFPGIFAVDGVFVWWVMIPFGTWYPVHLDIPIKRWALVWVPFVIYDVVWFSIGFPTSYEPVITSIGIQWVHTVEGSLWWVNVVEWGSYVMSAVSMGIVVWYTKIESKYRF